MPELNENVKTNGAAPPSLRQHIPLKEAPPTVQKRVALAQWFAKVGFGVIALNPGAKVPSDKRWNKDPLTIPERIEHMLCYRTEAGHFPNYGITPMGKHVVIDADNGMKKGRQRQGEANLLEAGDLPETLKVKTPSGGFHRFYLVTEAMTNSHTLPRDIDVRGDSGQVVGPGSELIEGLCGEGDTPGTYEKVEGKVIATAPEWLTRRLVSVAGKAAAVAKAKLHPSSQQGEPADYKELGGTTC